MPKLKKRKKPLKKEGRQEHCCFQECIRKAGHETESSSKQSRETDAALWGSKSHNNHSGAHKLQKTRRQVHRIKSTTRATPETKAYKATKEGPGRQRQRQSPIPLPRTVIRKNFLPHRRISLIWSQGKQKNSNTKKKKSKSDNSALKTRTKLQTATLLTPLSEKPKRKKRGGNHKKSGNFLVEITGASREKPLST
jgi:hypothetical protein